MNVEIHNLAVQIYDALNKNGAGLGNASIGIIESAIKKSTQQSVQRTVFCSCGDLGYGDKFNRCVTCGLPKEPRR